MLTLEVLASIRKVAAMTGEIIEAEVTQWTEENAPMYYPTLAAALAKREEQGGPPASDPWWLPLPVPLPGRAAAQTDYLEANLIGRLVESIARLQAYRAEPSFLDKGQQPPALGSAPTALEGSVFGKRFAMSPMLQPPPPSSPSPPSPFFPSCAAEHHHRRSTRHQQCCCTSASCCLLCCISSCTDGAFI